MNRTLIHIFLCIACLALGNLIWDFLVFIIKKVKEWYLVRHLNEGSENYLNTKNKIEECIKSGEINNYFEGFQLSRIDSTNDSETMKDLQHSIIFLTSNEKFKIKYFSKKLLDKKEQS